MAKAAAFTCALLVFGGPGISTAEAHMLHKHKGESKPHYVDRLVRHGETGVRWIKAHAPNYKTHRRYLNALRNHRWLLKYGKSQQRQKTKTAFSYPPHYSAWLCIHSYEGAWDDPNPPYYGGLQMDWDFMAAYGSSLLRAKGPANNWTPMEQMWVAENALNAGRGFYPWPTTARMCGLL